MLRRITTQRWKKRVIGVFHDIAVLLRMTCLKYEKMGV